MLMFSTLFLAIIFFSYSLIDFENDFSPSLSVITMIIDDNPQILNSSQLSKINHKFASDTTLLILTIIDTKYNDNKHNNIILLTT